MSDKLVGRPFPEKLVADLVNEREEKVKKKNNMNDKAINGIIDEKKKQKQEKIETRNKAVVNIVNEKKEKKEQFNKLANKAIELAKKRKSSNSVNAVTSVDMISKAPNDAVVTNGSFGGDMSVTESTNFDKAKKMAILSASDEAELDKKFKNIVNQYDEYIKNGGEVENKENIDNIIKRYNEFPKSSKPGIISLIKRKIKNKNNNSVVSDKKNNIQISEDEIDDQYEKVKNTYLEFIKNSEQNDLINLINSLNEKVDNDDLDINNDKDIKKLKDQIKAISNVNILSIKNIISVEYYLTIMMNYIINNKSEDNTSSNEEVSSFREKLANDSVALKRFDRLMEINSIKAFSSNIEDIYKYSVSLDKLLNLGDIPDYRGKQISEISKEMMNDLKNSYVKINSTSKEVFGVDLSPYIVRYKPEKNGVQGEGEVFVEFSYNNAESKGGLQSYDIQSSKGFSYEVKCYGSNEDSIRLGKEGKIFNYPQTIALLDLFLAIKDVLDFSNDASKYSIFYKMVQNVEGKKIGLDAEKELEEISKNNAIKYKSTGDYKGLQAYLDNLFKSKNFSKSSKKNPAKYRNKNNNENDIVDNQSYLDRLLSGEFRAGDMALTQEVFSAMKIIVDAVFNNKFEYAKLVNKGSIYIVDTDKNGTPLVTKPNSSENNNKVFLSCVPTGEDNEKFVINAVTKLKYAIDSAINSSIVDENAEVATSDFLKNIIIKISTEVSSEFEKTHPMIIISTNNQENICLGVYSQFMVTSISQAGYKIIPVPNGETLEKTVNNYLSQFAVA